ncbi:hypothetical protein ACFWII_29285 [Streptomyces sp. NPDC127063]|uniref:hypothetical protein n=1 Tax=Streptomyces sp. NPDC127063 TaxID=3347123 RepID=UPI0036575CF0
MAVRPAREVPVRRGLPRAYALWRRAPVRTPYASPLPYARAGPAPYKSGTLRCRHCLDRLGRHAEAAALRPRRRRERDAG